MKGAPRPSPSMQRKRGHHDAHPGKPALPLVQRPGRTGGDPEAQQCGWLEGRFGLSWQAIPRALAELVGDPASPNSARAMRAMLQMKKIDLEKIRQVYDGAA